MKIAVLGTGMVGKTIATKLISLGHEVIMGSRIENNPKAIEWYDSTEGKGRIGTFYQAAVFAELIFNCTQGMASIEVLESIGAKPLSNKILIDVSNPLDFSRGMPPTLSVCNDDSLGEQIQRRFPETKVVKTLNTVNCSLMVNPGALFGEHDLFISGNDKAAKEQTMNWLKEWFGWKNIIDLGDITTARGTEQLLPVWIRLWGALGHSQFNFHVVHGGN